MTRNKPPDIPRADIGDPPARLEAGLVAVWEELRALIPPDADLSPADQVTFEIAVRLTAKLRAGRLAASETVELRRVLDSLYLTPAGRERLQWRALVPRVN